MLQGWDCVPPHPTCSASHRTRYHTLQDTSATPPRAQIITDFLPSPLQIWLWSIFGQWVAKNYPTPFGMYQLTHVLQQVWQSKLFRPSSSTSQCCIECLSDNGSHTCCGMPWTWVASMSMTLKKKGGVILECTSLFWLLEIKWVLYKLLLNDWNKVSFSKLPMAFVCIFQLSVHVALNVLVTNHHACHHKQVKQVSVLSACRI